MSRGIVLFGVNNTKVDYIKLSIISASFIKKNMPNTNICLITDEWSYQAYVNGEYNLLDYFSDIVVIPSDFKEQFENVRTYKDTRYYGIDASFKNESRSLIYELSPYDETILIDSDYLICNNSLSAVWGNEEDILINSAAIGLDHKPLKDLEFRLNPFGIRMYWATVIYFKKNAKSKMLFDLVEHIKDNWDFYKLTYNFPGHIFRNDYAFSIAIHILNGFVEDGDLVCSLPDSVLLTALDSDQFFKIKSPNEMIFFYNDKRENWKFYVSKIKGLNIHCINKLSLLNNIDSIMKVLS